MEDKSEPKQRFAYALTAAMKAAHIKAPGLAARLNVAPKTVNRWVNGDALPNILMVTPLAEALSVDPSYLYDPKPVDVPTMGQPTTLTVVTGAARRARRDLREEAAPAQPSAARPAARPRTPPQPKPR